MAVPGRSDTHQKGYRLPIELLLRLADYCYWEERQYTETVKFALMEYVHQAEVKRGEPYPPSPGREKILKG